MSPRNIATAARERGLDLVALTDHNTARNTPAFSAACEAAGVAALYGTEVSTSEGVHALALFDDVDAARSFGEEIYASLESFPHIASRFGDQVVVDEDEMIVEELDQFLGTTSRFSLTKVGALIHERGGLFVPAHIDRSMYSVWSQLGFLPEDDYDAVEMIGAEADIDPGRHTVTCASDAHFLQAIGRRFISFETPDTARTGGELFRALQDAFVTGHVERHGM